MLRIKTPCIGVCSTGIGDDVCRGCKRFCHEVIDWNAYSNSQKRIVYKRLDALLSQLVAARIEVFNPERLRQQLDALNIRYNPELSPYSWVLDLLKAGASQITQLEPFGCRWVLPLQEESLPALRRTLEDEFFILSSVHYDRYFKRSVLC